MRKLFVDTAEKAMVKDVTDVQAAAEGVKLNGVQVPKKMYQCSVCGLTFPIEAAAKHHLEDKHYYLGFSAWNFVVEKDQLGDVIAWFKAFLHIFECFSKNSIFASFLKPFPT